MEGVLYSKFGWTHYCVLKLLYTNWCKDVCWI